jgi:predicted nucleic acid-binding protein
MIAYLDTSALVKLYVVETGTDVVRQVVQQSDTAAISAIGYPESRSVFARALRGRVLDISTFESIKLRFETDWLHLAVVPAAEPTLRLAGDLAERYTLRGFDSVHLASAMGLRSAQTAADVIFVAWDHRLLDAARGERFPIVGG